MKIYLIGAFGFDSLETGGQTVKSRELFWALAKEFGEESVGYIETFNWKKRPFSFFLRLLKNLIRSDAIIMLPAQNGVKVFARILSFFKKVFKKKVYYDVIGGWLPELVTEHPKLLKYLNRFNCVFVETSTMMKSLANKGVPCEVLPNFKRLTPVTLINGIPPFSFPLPLCIFSRITEKKGIVEAINTLADINREKLLFSLDIYGPIDPCFKETFLELLDLYPTFVRYKGCVSSDSSVEVLKDYLALLFPTKFFTEGVPGTIIDAYFSGLPVISSKWQSYSDVIEEGKTGFCFEFNDFDSLKGILVDISNDQTAILNMRRNCLARSEMYTPEYAMRILNKHLIKARESD